MPAHGDLDRGRILDLHARELARFRSGQWYGPQPRTGAEALSLVDEDLTRLLRTWLANRGVWEALPGAGPTVPVPAAAADVDRYLQAYAELLEQLTPAERRLGAAVVSACPKVSHPSGTLYYAMRHTTFRFALAPTPSQAALLARHTGASRFAYNQSLRLVTDALAARRADPQARVPRSGFDLINAFNAWKRSEAAGRVFVVTPHGTTTKHVTGLAWRSEVCAQVFEEAAVDLGRALAAYAEAKGGSRTGRIGFPRRKRKGRCRDSFRLRNKIDRRTGRSGIRVGDGHPRSVTLPRIGTVRVHDDTRRLRRVLRPVAHLDPETGKRVLTPHGKVLFATVSRHGTRWYVSLNVEAPDLHPQRRHRQRGDQDHGGWIGLDRGLAAFMVAATADGAEVGRWQAPRPLQRSMAELRRRARAVSRAQSRSRNRARATQRLSRQHARIADIRRNFLHEVSSRLVQTHDRLCLEDLAVANLMSNRRLARAIGDAAWTELARQLAYKQAWRGGQVMVANRWFPSTRTCSGCGRVKQQMGLAERIFACDSCGLVMDRDRNAAANLAAWAERHHAQAPDRQAGGRVTDAPGRKGAGRRRGDGATGPDEGGTDAHAQLA